MPQETNSKRTFITENLTIPNARTQWAIRLFTPDTEGQYADNKYSVILLIDKSDTETVAAIRKAIAEDIKKAIEAKLLDGPATVQYVQRVNAGDYDEDFAYPLHDGDLATKTDKETGERVLRKDNGEPELAGHWYITAKSAKRPRIYSALAVQYDLNDPAQLDRAKSDIYSGCRVNARVTFNAFGSSRAVRGGGVGVWLNAVQKFADDERLGGGPVDDGFSPVAGAVASNDGFAPAGAAAPAADSSPSADAEAVFAALGV
jgi:hypothetical protein